MTIFKEVVTARRPDDVALRVDATIFWKREHLTDARTLLCLRL
jgi:hypothetical protein